MQEPTSKTVVFAVFKTIELISFLNASAGPVGKAWKATAKISFPGPPETLRGCQYYREQQRSLTQMAYKKGLVRDTLTCGASPALGFPAALPGLCSLA